MPFNTSGEALSGLYYLNVYQSTNDDTIKWINRYLVELPAGSSPQSVDVMLTDFAQAHAAMLINLYKVFKVTLSTYEPDTRPYDANEFVAYETQMTGQGGNYANRSFPLNVVLYIRKNVNRGKNGKVFLRGVLHQDYVEVSSRGYRLYPQNGDFWPRYEQYYNILSKYFGGPDSTAESPFRLVMKGNPLRRVTGITIGTVTTRKLNNAYFDRR